MPPTTAEIRAHYGPMPPPCPAQQLRTLATGFLDAATHLTAGGACHNERAALYAAAAFRAAEAASFAEQANAMAVAERMMETRG